MKLKALLGVVFLLAGSPATEPQAGQRPIVAVFDVEAKRVSISKDMIEALADYLTSRLTETGKYQVVPREQLKARLVEQKKSSYRQCYDQKCQIELGRELAAEKTVTTQVSRFAKLCTLSVTIYDLGKATTEAAATARGGCDEAGLLESLERAIGKLVGSQQAPAATEGASGKTSGRGPAGIEWIYSKPAGIAFAKTETTVAQYRACLQAGKCTAPKSRKEAKYCNWGYPERDDHPVNCVDWHQAQAFCRWAGGRLPTEKEWLAEASNGGTRKYPWGDELVTCERAVWGDGKRTDGCGRNSTWPVCSKLAGNSISGLCDMLGNVWEWTASWLGSSATRIVRGNSWKSVYPDVLRPSYTMSGVPGHRGPEFGFRCVRSTP